MKCTPTPILFWNGNGVKHFTKRSTAEGQIILQILNIRFPKVLQIIALPILHIRHTTKYNYQHLPCEVCFDKRFHFQPVIIWMT